jgi:alpha-methylacyl-CoA racemase
MTLKPLSGLRVLDFTAMPPGGACTVLLADLGAEIIRVEPPAQKGKPSLVVGQVALSRGKNSLTLDMRNPRAAEILLRLAKTIDIVVENAKPGAMEARGFGYAQARAANPGIIWCAITGFGQTGPYADHAGHDLSYLAHSGLLGALSAEQGWQPALPLALQAGALSAVIAIQSALIQRGRNGEGGFIDLSLSEAAGWFLTCGINPLSERPLLLPASPDRRLYTCADGRLIAIACAEPRTWGVLCDQLGLAEYKDQLHKWPDPAAAIEALSAIFVTKPAAQWVAELAPLGAAATIMNHATQLFDDPQIQARGAVVTAAGVPVPASPVRLTAPDGSTTATATEPPHKVGEDTARLLRQAGFTAEEIAGLEQGGIV